ncbi:MAG: hypothetical protein AAFV95_27420 [Bacteroidota bacterium]
MKNGVINSRGDTMQQARRNMPPGLPISHLSWNGMNDGQPYPNAS